MLYYSKNNRGYANNPERSHEMDPKQPFTSEDLGKAYDYLYNMDSSIFDELIQSFSKRLSEEVSGIISNEVEEYRKLNPVYYSEQSNEFKQNYRSGYKEVKITIPVFLEIDVLLPKFRSGKFKSPYLTKLLEESDRFLVALIYSLYVNNISYEKISLFLEKLGIKLSHQTISNKLKKLSSLMEEYQNRDLAEKEIEYIVTDAVYVKERSSVKPDKAILTAVGITDTGEREIIGYSVDRSESELAWYDLFKNLQRRGLNMENIKLVTSDGNKGIKKYLIDNYPNINHQRCLWHLSNNILKTISFKQKPHIKKSMYADIFWIVTPKYLKRAKDKRDLDKLLKSRTNYIKRIWLSNGYKKEADKLIENIDLSLVSIKTLDDVNKGYKLITSNMIERYFRDYRAFSYTKRSFNDIKSIKRLTNLIFFDINYKLSKRKPIWDF